METAEDREEEIEVDFVEAEVVHLAVEVEVRLLVAPCRSWYCWAARWQHHHIPDQMAARCLRSCLLKHSAQVDLATEEVEVEGEEHPEVVAPLEEVSVEAQEEEASSVRREAQRLLSYVYKLPR